MARKPASGRALASVGAIYARYSSHFQHRIEDQVRVCREWADRNGVSVPEDLVFIDRAVSGRSSHRPGLKGLRQALRSDRAGVVIVFTTNRLYRKTYQSLAFVEEEVVDQGKRCVFVRSNIDTNDSERWRQVRQLHAMIDESLMSLVPSS